MSQHELIVIGASWGGLNALNRLLAGLPADLDAAVAIAQHRAADSHPTAFAELLQRQSRLPVQEADDKGEIQPGHVYLAPPDYHLLVEPGHFALDIGATVSYARPSLDVLFESAADAYRSSAIGVVLTGANEDGAAGLAAIEARGGYTIVQDPEDAERREMPRAALGRVTPNRVLPLDEIAPLLIELCGTRVTA